MDANTLADGRSSADAAGLVASVACAIHCAAMPLVIGYLPMLGLSWLADPSFHRVMAIVCFALALSAFLPGWKRHGSLAPTLFGSMGIALLSFAAFGLEGECCPSCAVVNTPKEPTTTCSDAGCVHCVSETPVAEPVVSSPSVPLAWAIPYITPLGGLFLVAGHVCNHRCSCACCKAGSCSNGSEPGADQASV